MLFEYRSRLDAQAENFVRIVRDFIRGMGVPSMSDVPS
jgi:hypothetical protein